MSKSANNFMENQERLYYQERSMISAEAEEEERKLWKFINEDKEILTECKDLKNYIYKETEQLQTQIAF